MEVVDVLSAIAVLFVCQVHGALEDVLYRYETLHHVELGHRIRRRSVDSNHPEERDVEFTTFGRHFLLRLQTRRSLFANGFKAFSVDANNKHKEINIQEDAFYEGYVDGEEDTSEVSAYFEDEALVTTVKTKDDVYVVEPSWRHLPASENYTMISYRGSDMKIEFNKTHPYKNASYCGFVNAGVDEAAYHPVLGEKDAFKTEQVEFESVHRQKRQTIYRYVPIKNTCPVLLVADYRFYEQMGQKSLFKATSYLIGLLDRVDSIYRRTVFSGGYTNMGFEIKEIRIHEQETRLKDPRQQHYNVKKAWKTKPLLEVFSRDSSFRQFCLAHLFTHQAFDGGVLGLAYIGSPRTYSVGGICTSAYRMGGYTLFLNTGWSSSMNRANRRILTQEADLVTAHEFGHNWGSEHDPDTAECSPSSNFKNGKYIMYTYAVSGYDANNKYFSPCSRKSIGAVLRAKSSRCFTAKSKSFCGNTQVELPEEECDGGPEGQKGRDPCCTKSCKLKYGAKCSDKNHVCCKNCRIAPSSLVCRVQQDDASCEETTKCSGTSEFCPDPQPKNNGTDCLERGKCYNGVCLSLCEANGLVSCICNEVEDSCKWCCKNSTYGPCMPYMETPTAAIIHHGDGKPCTYGFCEKGVCKKQKEDLVERLWKIVEDITPDKIVKFMRANIVGTVIVFSLILWIPASCVISFMDRKRVKKEEEEQQWFNRSNQNTIRRRSQASQKPQQEVLRNRRLMLHIPQRRHEFDAQRMTVI